MPKKSIDLNGTQKMWSTISELQLIHFANEFLAAQQSRSDSLSIIISPGILNRIPMTKEMDSIKELIVNHLTGEMVSANWVNHVSSQAEEKVTTLLNIK